MCLEVPVSTGIFVLILSYEDPSPHIYAVECCLYGTGL
jgi:hypothetical protein